MLVPCGHDRGVRRWPYVTLGIIAICTLMHLWVEFGGPSDAEIMRNPEAIMDHPLMRFAYWTGSGFNYRMITSAFVHAGWLHLIGNMLFLWLAGSAVEDRYGHAWFGVFYLLGAVVSQFAFDLVWDGPSIPAVGASGAISATMGAFLVHYSKTNIMFWYWWYFRTGTFTWPAYVALPLWLADQVLWAWLAGTRGTGIAYGAHIGGFAFGFAWAFAAKRLIKDPDDPDPDPQLPPAVAMPVDREKQLIEAISKGDLGTVRTLASRVLLDLAKTGDDARIVELWKAMRAKFEKVPLTDGAFVATATAADKLGDKHAFIEIAEAVLVEHPGSNQVPKVMWRLAELKRDRGELDAAIELLRTLASRFPRDSFGQKAREALESRGIG